MKLHPETPPPDPAVRLQRRSLVKAVRVLTQPPGSIPVLDRRRAHLLAWLLLVMILLTITGLMLVLIVDPPGSPRREAYVKLILLILALFGLAYGLVHAAYYRLSAVLTILGAVFGPWGSLLVDPGVVRGDFVPLTYVVISILLASILLHPLFTSLLAALHLTALLLVIRFSPATFINWPSLLALIFFTSVLSILANLISQRDLEQIDHQKQKLAQNEAQQTALALLKTQMLEEAGTRIKQLTVLHEVVTVATQVDNIDHLIESTTEIIGRSLFPDNCGVLLLDEEQGLLHPHPSYRFRFDTHSSPQAIPVSQGVTGQVARTGQSIRIGSIEVLESYIEIDPSTASELCVPITFKGKVLGVINAESTRPEAFSVEDEHLLWTVAGQLAATIEQLRATAAEHRWLAQLAHSNELINALAHITTHLQKSLSQEEILQTMGDELSKIGLTCAMAVRDSAQKSFTIKYTSLPKDTLERLEHNTGSPFLGSTLFVNGLKSTIENEDFRRPALITQPDEQMQLFFPAWQARTRPENEPGKSVEKEPTYLRLPLVFEETLTGILWVWSRFLTEADLSVMSTFALQVASGLKRARLFQEVQSLALTDPLTGLMNRRSLFELGRVEFVRSQRLDRPFCCLMLDLDHFKKINDNYGHPVGDRVVQEFAERCKRSVREIDLIGRYGGEEVVIFLPETDSDTALHIAERLRESIAQTPIRSLGQELPVTVSVGVSKRDEHTLELETLIARADQAMYIAKHKGRNRVAISR